MKLFFKKLLKAKKLKAKSYKLNTGFTLIETMISISLFVIIIISGIGALVNTNLVGSKAQNMRSIMDNLNFIMEDMSRNLKTGYNFHCDLSGVLTDPNTCSEGSAIVFEEANGDTENANDQWVYKIASTRKDKNGKDIFDISKSIESGADGTFVQLNPDEVILSADSSFSVLGDSGGINAQQPMVIIRLIGEIYYKDTKTPFSIQTSASQRFIDN